MGAGNLEIWKPAPGRGASAGRLDAKAPSFPRFQHPSHPGNRMRGLLLTSREEREHGVSVVYCSTHEVRVMYSLDLMIGTS